mgnify:CR=1 FL=1
MSKNEIVRCGWCGSDELYQSYHDNEWGKPVKDDKTLFEFLILESAQAGLSWITILRKREGYRKAFSDFDYQEIAQYNHKDVERLLQDSQIIRNKLKINSTISNAKVFMVIQKEFGSFYNYLYSFLPEQKPILNHVPDLNTVPATTELSNKIAKDLKKRGIKFFGPTTCYAYMQAVGMVNDHLNSCSFR